MSSYILYITKPCLTVVTLLFMFISSIAQAQPSGRVFVTNERGNSVSVINAETLEVEHEIAIGERPRGIGISPDGSEVYVAISGENAIAVFDPMTLKVLRKFASGSDPETFAVHPNGNLYISNEDDAKATVYDPKTGKLVAEIPVGLEPEGVAISPDGTKVIVTSESTNMLHMITVPGNIVTDNILVGSRPRAATFTQDSKFIYATAEISGEIVKVDVEKATVVQRLQLTDQKSKPKDILLSRDEQYIYVAGGRASKIWLLKTSTLEIIKGIPVGQRVWGLALSKDGKRLFSTDGASHSVSVIDTTTNEVIKTIAVGKFPWGVVSDY